MPLVEGFDDDKAYYVICLLLAFPISTLLRYVLPQDRTLRLLLSPVIGIAMGVLCLGYQIYHSLLSTTLCYIILKVFPRKNVQLIVFAFTMTYMSGAHIYRQIYDYGGWTLDFTGPQMILTQRLTSLAWNVHDGAKKKKDADGEGEKKSKLPPDVVAYIDDNALPAVPSPLEYYSYLFSYNGFLAGPFFEFSTYMRYIDGTNFAVAKAAGVPPPSGLLPALKKFVLSVACAATFLYCDNFPAVNLVDPAVAGSVADASFPQRLFWTYLTCFGTRAKYYFAWLLADGACNAAGLGFNGFKKGSPEHGARWDGVSNVDVFGVELAQNFKTVIDNWNIGTARWLKMYVYMRVPFQKTLITYITSAFWHGFYPGYYLTFITGGVWTLAARKLRGFVRPKFLTADGKPTSTKPVFDIAGIFLTIVVLNYCCVPFLLLELKSGVTYYASFYCLPHIAAALCLVGLPSPRRSPPK